MIEWMAGLKWCRIKPRSLETVWLRSFASNLKIQLIIPSFTTVLIFKLYVFPYILYHLADNEFLHINPNRDFATEIMLVIKPISFAN